MWAEYNATEILLSVMPGDQLKKHGDAGSRLPIQDC